MGHRVVDQDVGVTKGLLHRQPDRCDLAVAGDITGQRQRLTTGLPDRLSRLFGSFGIDVNDHDLAAFSHQGLADGQSDTARCAGDDGDLVLEFHG